MRVRAGGGARGAGGVVSDLLLLGGVLCFAVVGGGLGCWQLEVWNSQLMLCCHFLFDCFVTLLFFFSLFLFRRFLFRGLARTAGSIQHSKTGRCCECAFRFREARLHAVVVLPRPNVVRVNLVPLCLSVSEATFVDNAYQSAAVNCCAV